MKRYPTISYLRSCLTYASGKVFWLKRPRSHFVSQRAHRSWNTKHANREAGGQLIVEHGPRWTVCINGSRFLRSRIVWALVHGKWPSLEIDVDHKDRNSINDSAGNLRLATRSQNQANAKRPRHNTSGLKGASRCKGGWQSQIRVNGKVRYLGMFTTAEKAHAAYMREARSQHGEFAYAGTS